MGKEGEVLDWACLSARFLADLEAREGARFEALADVGDGVYVTSYAGCGNHGEFDLSIHIWRPENLEQGFACARVLTGEGPGLTVELREGECLSRMKPSLEDVTSYMARPGRLLIHCVAGMHRAPTLAVLAKLARGRDFDEAVEEVYMANLEQRGLDQRLYPGVYESLREWVLHGQVE